MKKAMKKWMAVVVFGVLALVFVTGCSKKVKFPEGFTEEGVKAQAEADITLGESNDYEGWVARFPEEYQSQLTKEAYDSYLALLESKGAFQSFGKAAYIPQEQDGKSYVSVVYIVKHEKGDVKYTLSYDEDMKLIQFLI